jgi:hypothetical protein
MKTLNFKPSENVKLFFIGCLALLNLLTLPIKAQPNTLAGFECFFENADGIVI